MEKRFVVLDTETTGLDWRKGDRLVEIAAIEIIDRRKTGGRFHCYLDPERDIEESAQAVHGISRSMLIGKPKFSDVATAFLDFVRGATLVIHNASFDLGFINSELERIGFPRIESMIAGVIDTVKVAKEIEPTKRASLDALCDRYGVDKSQRTFHSALLDAELLAEIFLALSRGQELLAIEEKDEKAAVPQSAINFRWFRPPHFSLKKMTVPLKEKEEHSLILAEIERVSKSGALWNALNKS